MGFWRMRHFVIAAVATLGGLAASGFWHEAAPPTPPSGQLKCHVAGGMSFIIGSSRQVDCIYTPSGGGVPEAYTGSINKIGIDLGWEKGGVLLWGGSRRGSPKNRARSPETMSGLRRKSPPESARGPTRWSAATRSC
jgi:hypothetical protein